MEFHCSYHKRPTSDEGVDVGTPISSPRISGQTTGMRGRPTLYGNRMVTVSFRVPASYVERIKEYCKKTKESKSDFFRRAIDMALHGDDVARHEPDSVDGDESRSER